MKKTKLCRQKPQKVAIFQIQGEEMLPCHPPPKGCPWPYYVYLDIFNLVRLCCWPINCIGIQLYILVLYENTYYLKVLPFVFILLHSLQQHIFKI